MRNSFCTGALLALIVLLAGCGRSDSSVTSSTDDVVATANNETTTQTDGDRALPSYFVEVLPPDLVESVAYLQDAIDIRLENYVVQCMREAGFEYQPLAVGGPPPVDNPVLAAIERLDRDAEPFKDPNGDVLAALSPTEVSAWQNRIIDCAVNSPHNRANPLASGFGWESATVAANQRVQADPRFLEAIASEERCKAQEGYEGDVLEQISRIDDEATELAFAGDQTSDVISRLYELLDQRAILEGAESLCTVPRFELTGQLYEEFLGEELRNNPQIELWLAELRATVESYAPEIATILEG